MADWWHVDRRRKLMVRGLGWCLCVGLWTAALLTTTPVRAGEAVVPQVMHFPLAKFLHVSVYAFLTLYVSWLPLRRWRWALLAFLSLHAAGTEYFQQFVPGRHGQVGDVLIDHVGIVLGLALNWRRWTSAVAPTPRQLSPLSSPLPCTQGRGAGGEGKETCGKLNPSPQPLSPEYRGEGLPGQTLTSLGR